MTATIEPLVAHALAAFRLGAAHEVRRLGGTATRKWGVITDTGRFVVRVRPAEFGNPESAAFDHIALAKLAAAGLPVPNPQSLPDGKSILWTDGHAVEVLSWVEGDAFSPGDADAAHALGRFLARFHQVLANNFPPGKASARREDHPDEVAPHLSVLFALATDTAQSQQLHAIGDQIEFVRQELDARLYPGLPRAVIHGDIHPGNIRFRNGRVSALYDFDYLSVQARARDVIDALAFFASNRRQPFDTDRIQSLTQPFVPQFELSRAILAGYQSVQPLTDDEWQALPLLLLSRWLQMRLRGSRKVAPAEKIAFVLDRISEVPDWLHQNGRQFFAQLKIETS